MHRNISFVIFMVICMVFAMPSVYAASILEGEAQTVSGATVYVAEVLPGQTFSSVFGVKGSNANYYSYGSVRINGGTVSGTVFGARATENSDPVHASYNEVDITDGTIDTVYGGYAYGGNNNAGVQNNSVKINGGNISGYIYGGSADGSTISITGNSVEVKNATVNRTVYGACAYNTSSWLSMLRNTVTIENTDINVSVYGGYASGSATAANNNTVIIKGNSNIRGSVYGGYASSSNSDAKNNTVIIEGGTLKNHIYGGIGKNAVGNTIVIKGGDLSAAYLYGYSDGRKSHSGNTLELWTSEVSVKSVCNFENYFFLIPKDIIGTTDFMLRTQTPVNLNDSKVAVALQNGAVLNVGDKINLIDKAEGTPTLTSLEGLSVKGGTLLTNYDFNLVFAEGGLTAVATSEGRALMLSSSSGEPAGEVIPEAQSLLGNQIASVALLTEAADFAADTGMAKAKAELHSADKRVATFLATGLGKNHYDASSHVKMDTAEFIAGIAGKIAAGGTCGQIGAFIESGNGYYSTFNSFENGSVSGDGNARYYGAGVMFSIEPVSNKGLYFRTAGHMGSINSDWSSNDFKEKISYDTDPMYYGATADAGYAIKEAENVNCDVYGRLSWVHQKGDSADINGEKLQFEALDSVKTRLGTRITYEKDVRFNAYFGFAWEREFNKQAKAKVNEYRVEVAGLAGDSLCFELGTTFKVRSNVNWQFSLSAIGCTGVRRGFDGTASFTFLI